MNQTQALAKLKKVYGPKLGYRTNPKAPDAQAREKARENCREVKALLDACREAKRARLQVLCADETYQALKRQEAQLERDHGNLTRLAYGSYRITVGVSSLGSMFFSVKAEGDNWADVVAKATGAQS